MKRISVIVIGSNSTRLLAADANAALSNPLRGREETRLFLGMSEDRNLTGEAVAATVRSVSALKALADSSSAELIGIYATSATRDAKNRQTLSDAVLASCGLPLTVLSGEEEAAFSFFGAAGSGKCGVIDIGGGSTEVILGEEMHIDAAHSLQLGASRLFKSNPINTVSDVASAVAAASAIIEQLPAKILSHEQVESFSLIGGTGTSLARILGQPPEGCILSRNDIEKLLLQMAATPRDKRAEIPGFPPARADILPTGTSILLALLDALRLSSVRVTERVNADGILLANVHKKFA